MAKKGDNGLFMRLAIEYFNVSLRTWSTWLLILFNLYLIFGLISNNIDILEVMYSYLAQMVIFLIGFSVFVMSMKKFISKYQIFEGKGVKISLLIAVVFIWVIYGSVISFIGGGLMQFNPRFGLFFYISIGLLLLQYLMFFVNNYSDEIKRLEKIELIKIIFEPAQYLFPIFLAIVFFSGLYEKAAFVIIIIKTIGDVIINSPLNSQEPFVYKYLVERHKQGLRDKKRKSKKN